MKGILTSLFSVFACFMTTWLTVLMIILPIKVTIKGDYNKGEAISAPAVTYFKRKLWISALLAVLITGGLVYLIKHNHLGRDFWENNWFAVNWE